VPPVRRSTVPVATPTTSKPAAPPPADLPDVEEPSTGWGAPLQSRRPASGDSLQQTASSAEAAAAGLAPKLDAIAPAPMLKALGDGTATIDVPMKAGTYKVKGISFTVKPGTVAHVNVQVKNGELVPVGHGQKGTGVKVDPPLDLPLWVTGQGVELKGDDAKQKFDVELGGFFDLHFKAKKLSELVSGGGAAVGGSGSSASAPSNGAASPSPFAELAGQLIDPTKLKVDARVTLRDATLDVGGAKVKVDPTTTFSVKGDGQHASLSGHVQLDGFSLNQGGVQLASHGGGQAELSATMDRVATGYQLDSRLTGARLSVDSLTSAHPSSVAPGKVDSLSLGPTEVHDGSIHHTSQLGMNGLKPTGLSKPTVELSFKGSGTVNDAQLTVKDSKDTAHLAVKGNFNGTVGLGPDGLKFDAQVTGAHVDVRDLQETLKGSQVSIDHAVADGDLHITNKPGQLLIDGQAHHIDVLVDDFKGGAKGVKADLGRTAVTGDGSFHVGSDGVDVEGRLHGSATIDAASFSNGKTKAALGSSTVSGDVTKLDLRGGAANLRLENVTADLGVKRASLDVGQASVQGGGRVKASGTVVLDGDGFALDGKGQLSMQLDDGRVHSSSVDLSLAKGSKAELNINELSFGKTTKVGLGPGTQLDAVLAGGSVKVGGNTVQLESGGRAQFSVNHVDVKNGKADLLGSLKLDGRVKGDHLKLPEGAHGSMTVHPSDVEGRLKVSVDGVHLADDRLSFSNGQVSLDATIGHYTGAKVLGQPGVGTMQDPVPSVSVEDVKKSTAAQLAGVTAPPPVPGSPVDALKLLRDGQLRLDVPMQGSIHHLGMDLVKIPPGARLDLSLSVHDGKVVAADSKATLTGGVTALGVEVLGVHLDDKLRLHADLKFAGKSISVPVPGVHIPVDMEDMTAMGTKPASPSSKSRGSSSSPASSKPSIQNFFDITHAQLDVTNATVKKGRIPLPGGSVDVTDGARISFHGTPLAGELTGSLAFDALTLNEQTMALKSRDGRGDLRLTYHREGDKAVVDGGLTNLSANTDYVAAKFSNGGYLSVGQGRASGGQLVIHSSVPVDANGLPKFEDATESTARITLGSFAGELKGGHIITHKGLDVTMGASQVDLALAWGTDTGVTVKGTVDTINGELSHWKLGNQGTAAATDVERARVRGTGARIDIGPNRVAFDGAALAWDITGRQVEAAPGTTPAGPTPIQHGQVHISGEGHLAFDSHGEIRLDGQLKVEGSAAADLGMAKSVTVKRGKGVKVTK
jgi:hypothetical protein